MIIFFLLKLSRRYFNYIFHERLLDTFNFIIHIFFLKKKKHLLKNTFFYILPTLSLLKRSTNVN